MGLPWAKVEVNNKTVKALIGKDMKAIFEAFSSITFCNKSLLNFDICHFCYVSRFHTNTFNSIVTLHFGARLSSNWMYEESFSPSVCPTPCVARRRLDDEDASDEGGNLFGIVYPQILHCPKRNREYQGKYGSLCI